MTTQIIGDHLSHTSTRFSTERKYYAISHELQVVREMISSPYNLTGFIANVRG